MPYLISYPLSFSKKFMGFFPKIGAMAHLLNGRMMHIRVYNMVDKTFEIPFFNNAYLSYNVYGDYAKYLERIEIVEHPFHYLKVRTEKSGRCTTWRGMFYFSRKPVRGYMEIKYL